MKVFIPDGSDPVKTKRQARWMGIGAGGALFLGLICHFTFSRSRALISYSDTAEFTAAGIIFLLLAIRSYLLDKDFFVIHRFIYGVFFLALGILSLFFKAK